MIKEKAAGASAPNGLVDYANSAPAFYQASLPTSTDIAPWEPIAIGMTLAISRISRAYALSLPLARAVAENACLGGRSR